MEKKRKLSLERKHNLTGWAFLLPAAILIFVFCFYPMIQALMLSFNLSNYDFPAMCNITGIVFYDF